MKNNQDTPRGFYDYIECALWSSMYFKNEDDSGTPFDQVDAELAAETEEAMKVELIEFFAVADGILEKFDGQMGDAQIAHDFWLTRNGHGAGFWDRGLGKMGDELSEAAKVWGSVDLYLGDDGMIYQQ